MLTARQMLKVVVLTAIVAAFVVPAIAEEEAAPEVTLTGVVSATVDANGAITAVQLTVGDVVYQVVLDDTGKKLGTEMNGKEAEVTGVVTTEGEQKSIKVSGFKAVEEE